MEYRNWMSVFGLEIYINPIILKMFDLVLKNSKFDPLVFWLCKSVLVYLITIFVITIVYV